MRLPIPTVVGALAVLGVPVAPAAGAGLTPRQLHAAYALPKRAPTRQTVAVIVAYDAPTAERDLARYTGRFRLPACRAARRCFRKVNQRGARSPLPRTDPTGQWRDEAALSTQVARAVCQNCSLLLVEADSDGKADLSAAVGTAVRLGARQVATSFVPVEASGDLAAFGRSYERRGVAITAATGDQGFSFGANFPAALPGVVAVGGTHLTLGRGGRYVRESAWSSRLGIGASGCSAYFSAAGWQARSAARAGCAGKRAVADVAAVADPGALVYRAGWFEGGGTSLSSPLVAAAFALAGGVPRGVSAPSLLYRHLGDGRALRDVTRGSTGTCSGRAICRAVRGYDGPTGVGTPKGLRAFRALGSPTGGQQDRPRWTSPTTSR